MTIDVLFFGDSVAERVANQDADRRPLNLMVLDNLRERSMGTVVHEGYNPKMFWAVLRSMEPHGEMHPRVVVLPINLRAFSSQWHAHPRYQFAAKRGAFEALRSASTWGMPETTAGEPGPAAWDAYAKTPVRLHLGLPDTTAGELRLSSYSKPVGPRAEQERKRKLFAWHYLERWDTSHEQAQCLVACSQLLLEHDIALMCYITPINWEAGVRYHGDGFLSVVKKGAGMLCDLLSSWVTVADWSTLLGSDGFFNADDSTEHLCESGRVRVAEGIAAGVRDLLGE